MNYDVYYIVRVEYDIHVRHKREIGWIFEGASIIQCKVTHTPITIYTVYGYSIYNFI